MIKTILLKAHKTIYGRLYTFLDQPYSNSHDVLLDKWVKEQIDNIPDGSSIIDLGAGEQKYRKICHKLRYISQDFCQYDGSGNGAGLHMGSWNTSGIDIVSDIINVPVDSNSFDAVLCTEVFEHIPDPVAALNEIYRILKKGGVLILTAPFMSETHFAPYHYCTGFDKYWYEYYLDKCGFEEYQITHYGNLFSRSIDSLTIVIKNMKRQDKIWGLLFRKIVAKYAVKDTSNSYEISCNGWNVVARK